MFPPVLATTTTTTVKSVLKSTNQRSRRGWAKQLTRQQTQVASGTTFTLTQVNIRLLR